MDRLDMTDYPQPDISGTYWGSITDSTFRPVVSISNPEAVQNVRFAVWTTGNQSDLRWYDARFNGVKEYFQDINFSDFNNKRYICHVYVYGKNGSTQSVEMDRLDLNNYPKPDIKGVYWGSVTDSTFRPVIVITNPESIENVRFAIWTTSDQRDLQWYDANYNGLNEYFKDVEYSDFETQHYFCHVYVYGKDGSTQSVALNDFDTYSAEGNFESATGGVGCVTVSGYAFDRSNIQENIVVHCYLKDSKGTATFLGEIKADQEREDVNNKYSVSGNHGFEHVFTTALIGMYTVEVSVMNIGGGNDVTFLGAKEITITQPTIFFDCCGGTECESIKVINTQNYGSLPVTTRTGYIFDGWYTEKEGGQRVTGDDTVNVTSDQTLFAHWTKCEHKDVEIRDRKEATCTTEGYSGDKYCSVCGQIVEKGEIILKLNHTWDNGKVTREATCTTAGEKIYTCTSCQETKTESIAKTGHTEVKDAAVAATCESEGKTEGSHCSICNTIIKKQETIPATGHIWDNGKVTKEATCTETGEKTYTCTTCQKTRTESIAKTGHTEVKDAAVAATCESEGKTEGSHCSVCGAVIKAQESIPAIGHIWDNGKVTKEATCTETGEKTYTCTACQKTKTEVIVSTGHSKITKFVKNATCETEGYTGDIYCNNCGEMLREGKIIEKLSHDWKQTGTKKATCTVKGEKIYTCNRCKKTKTEQIPAIGHKWSSWKKLSDATVFQKEKQKRTCNECGTSQSREYGSKLKSVMRTSCNSLLLKKKQTTNALTVSGMAKGDYVSKVQSGNNGIVKVTKYTKDGKIQLAAQGKTGGTKVIIRLAGGAVKQINVKVQKGTVKTTSIKVSPSKVTLKKGAKKIISVTVSPATSQEKVTYTSSNKNIATISTKGMITAKKQGTAKITVKSGSKKQIITVTVK